MVKLVNINKNENTNENKNTNENNCKTLKCSHCKDSINEKKFYYDYYNDIKLHIKCVPHI